MITFLLCVGRKASEEKSSLLYNGLIVFKYSWKGKKKRKEGKKERKKGRGCYFSLNGSNRDCLIVKGRWQFILSWPASQPAGRPVGRSVSLPAHKAGWMKRTLTKDFLRGRVSLRRRRSDFESSLSLSSPFQFNWASGVMRRENEANNETKKKATLTTSAWPRSLLWANRRRAPRSSSSSSFGQNKRCSRSGKRA